MALATLTTCAILLALIAPAHATAPPGCAGPAAGGEWRSFNGDLTNSRHQSDENLIGPQNVGRLVPRWSFTLPQGFGLIDATPIVADGCVYVATSSRFLYAFNADTGALVWRVALLGSLRSTPAVSDGRIFLNVNSFPRTTVALNQATGQMLWERAWDNQSGTQFFASPVVFNGMVLSVLSGLVAEEEQIGTARLEVRGSYAILDAVTGAVRVQNYTISDEDHAQGHAGVGLWATPAVDLATGYAYEGTGNAFSAVEHPHANSIIKIDVDPGRPTFGEIVGVYHGTYDQYVPGLDDKPLCRLFTSFATCELLDLDFGASPQLFTDTDGRLLVGDHQKSGVYHVADASSMDGVWTALVGGPWALGGVATAAYDGTGIFVAGSGGQAFAFNKDHGDNRWLMPLPDTQTGGEAGQTHSQPVTTANGVTYLIDGRGLLTALDAATGEVLLMRPTFLDAGQEARQQFASLGAGISIARHHVYVPSGRNLVVYQLPSDAGA